MKSIIIGFFLYSQQSLAADCVYKNATEENKIQKLNDLVERINVEANRCSYSNANKKPKHLIYLFEGRNGFSKNLLVQFKKFQSLNPKCEKDAGGNNIFVFPDGKWIFAENLKAMLDGIVNPETTGTAVGLKNFIVEGFCNSGANFQDTEVMLWGQEEGVEEAVKCIKKQFWNRYDDQHTPTLMVLGYSRGGARAIEFSNIVTANGIKIDQGLTVDPVPTKHGQTLAKILPARIGISVHSHVPGSFSIPKKTNWENFWQESDNRWDVLKNTGAGLHGSPVSGADVNKLIKPPIPENLKEANGAHWRIFFNEEIKKSISNQLSRVNNLEGSK